MDTDPGQQNQQNTAEKIADESSPLQDDAALMSLLIKMTDPRQVKLREKRHAIKEREDRGLVDWNTIANERLIKALIKAAESPDLLRLFLDELMPQSEIEKCATKLEAVELMFMAAPYDHITKMTGLSSTTIAKISKLLVNKRGGYQTVMKKLHPSGVRYFD